MGLGSVSWDLSIPSGVRRVVVLLVVVWPIVSYMPIYDGFLDVYMFGMLHVVHVFKFPFHTNVCMLKLSTYIQANTVYASLQMDTHFHSCNQIFFNIHHVYIVFVILQTLRTTLDCHKSYWPCSYQAC
jgi:hypothetical protein